MSKYKKGSIVKGSICGIESYGAFVNLDDYYSGLIHISEISHGFVKDINDFVKIGQPIRAKVIDVDDDLFQIKLSIKDLNYKSNKSNKTKIEEKGSGFRVLEDNLGNWIDDKMKEIRKE
ncbi:MAG TPA: CvfD/Ygs/GSP13 family RNA-binding post-transcriptional regulator [Bacilli bacterium]|nr:CvfD/Ygs/GSP13 family RNA-binding post-transcriptional regulator [Bacilli bacterium]